MRQRIGARELTRRQLLHAAVAATGGAVLAACARTSTPQAGTVVKGTVIVEGTPKKVEEEVTKVVPEQVLGLVVVRTEEGMAQTVAREASTRWSYPDEDIYLVMGVRWAAVAADGQVFLAVRAANTEDLDALIHRIRGIKGVANPTVYPVVQYYKDGRPAAAGHNGLP